MFSDRDANFPPLDERKLYTGTLERVALLELSRGSGRKLPHMLWSVELDLPKDDPNYPLRTFSGITSAYLTRDESNLFRKFFRGLTGRNPADGEQFPFQHWTQRHYDEHPNADPEELTGRSTPWRVAVRVARPEGMHTQAIVEMYSQGVLDGHVPLSPEITGSNHRPERRRVQDADMTASLDPRISHFQDKWEHTSEPARAQFERLCRQLPRPPIHQAEHQLATLFQRWFNEMRVSARTSTTLTPPAQDDQIWRLVLHWLTIAGIVEWRDDGWLHRVGPRQQLHEVIALFSLWHNAGRPPLATTPTGHPKTSSPRGLHAPPDTPTSQPDPDSQDEPATQPEPDDAQTLPPATASTRRGALVATLLSPVLGVGVWLITTGLVSTVIAGWIPSNWLSPNLLDWLAGPGVRGDAANLVRILLGLAAVTSAYTLIHRALRDKPTHSNPRLLLGRISRAHLLGDNRDLRSM